MSKNIRLNETDYTGVSMVQLPITGGGSALFRDIDEITSSGGDSGLKENQIPVYHVTGEYTGSNYTSIYLKHNLGVKGDIYFALWTDNPDAAFQFHMGCLTSGLVNGTTLTSAEDTFPMYQGFYKLTGGSNQRTVFKTGFSPEDPGTTSTNDNYVDENTFCINVGYNITTGCKYYYSLYIIPAGGNE